MSSDDLLAIHPQEIRFILEYKKPSSCSIRLANKSDYHVAFKVKTTSSTKYCARPNAGVIKPNSASDFTVTMQPQSVPPRDFICKDKFLVQSTIVPKGTKEEHITSSMFAKEDGKLVEEKKLKVILLSPFNSPVLSPMNAISRMRPSFTTTDSEDHWVENNSFHAKVDEDTEVYRRDSGLLEATKYEHSISTTHTDDLKFSKDLEEMKSRLKELESLHRQENLRTDQNTRTTIIYDVQEILRNTLTTVTGFQVLFVSVVALVSLCLGYMLHS